MQSKAVESGAIYGAIADVSIPDPAPSGAGSGMLMSAIAL